MDGIRHPTAQATPMDTDTGGTPGWPKADGSTVPTPDSYTHIMGELTGLLEMFGETWDPTNIKQLKALMTGVLAIAIQDGVEGALTTLAQRGVICSADCEVAIASLGGSVLAASLSARLVEDFCLAGGYSETPLAPGGETAIMWKLCAKNGGWAWIGDALKVGPVGGANPVFSISVSDGYIRIGDGLGATVAEFDLAGNLTLTRKATADELALSDGENKSTRTITGPTPAAAGDGMGLDMAITVEYNEKIAANSQIEWSLCNVTGTDAYPVMGWVDIGVGQAVFHVRNFGSGAVTGSQIRYVIVNPAVPG